MVEDPRKTQYLAGEAESMAARRLAEAFTVGRDLTRVLRRDVEDAYRPGLDPEQRRTLGRVGDAREELWRAFNNGQDGADRSVKDAQNLGRYLDRSQGEPLGSPAPAEILQHLGKIMGQLRQDLHLAGILWTDLAREVSRPPVEDPALTGTFRRGNGVGELAEIQQAMMAAAEQLARADLYIELSDQAARDLGAAVTAALWQGLTGMRPPAVGQEAQTTTREESGPGLA